MADYIKKKSNVGRPLKRTEDLVRKLESILKIGGTIDQACSYARISRETYYRWLEEDKDFMTRMESAKYYSDIAAKNIVVKSILEDKNLESAKWWLEKREFKHQNNTAIQINNFTNIVEEHQHEIP